MSRNQLLFIAGLLGATGVALGAFGAHTLRELLLHRQTTNPWQTAVFYHLIHSTALLALTGKQAADSARVPPKVAAAAYCWIGGIILFSGSLYGLALGAPRGLGPLTPMGGLLFLAGWVLVMINAATNSHRARPPARNQ